MKNKNVELSVVIPCYNEAENVPVLYKQLIGALKGIDFEIVYVDDGSRDDTLDELHKLSKKDERVRIVSLSRNFGKEIATTAGITQARGEAVIMVDADGQFPPELIPKFVEKWRAGAQIVTGVRLSNEKEGFIKRYGSKLFYKIIRSMAHIEITPRATDFRLIDKDVREEFLRFSERGRITRGLLDWVGFRNDFIEFRAKPRMAGEATYSVKKLIKLATDSFVSLSLAPLYFSGYAGLIITPFAFLLGLFVFIEQVLLGDPWDLNFTGTAMLGILLLFFVGILLVSQGLIALYISHIHTETQNRPLYIVNRKRSARL